MQDQPLAKDGSLHGVFPIPSLKRNPLDSLSSFVNSFELKAVSSKISHSASTIGRSMSHKMAHTFPLSPSEDFSDDNDENDENNSTLNDEEWLSSPSQKKRINHSNMSTHTLLDADCLKEEENVECQYEATSPISTYAFASNEHLPDTPISTFSVPQDIIPRIDEKEMFKILQGEYSGQFDEFIIVDCRFSYEYEGGHIKNAINISLPEDLEERLYFHNSGHVKRLVIFHCEFSLLRGPTLACHLRKLDRVHNSERYPYLSYPDIVVLEGGYKRFFEAYRNMCRPQAYVSMKDNNHRKSCEAEMNKVLLASKLTRAKSFNQFQPRRQLGCHSRSNSLTALLSCTEQQLLSPTSGAPLRKKRSLKIKKRDRKDIRQPDLRGLFTQSLTSLPSYDMHKTESPESEHFVGEDFAPPTALFRGHSKSLSFTLISGNSSQLLLYSETLSPAFSSLDSLLESYSPFPETPEFFEGTNHSGHLFQGSPHLFPTVSPVKSTAGSPNRAPKAYSFPKQSPYVSQKAAPWLQASRPSIYPNTKLTVSSPTVRLPLNHASSSFDMAGSGFSSAGYCDSINETPVECSINLKGYRRPMIASDLNEVQEETGF